MTFGFNKEGGERRLNVLISRAKEKDEINKMVMILIYHELKA